VWVFRLVWLVARRTIRILVIPRWELWLRQFLDFVQQVERVSDDHSVVLGFAIGEADTEVVG
jgi:hypothetical protein